MVIWYAHSKRWNYTRLVKGVFMPVNYPKFDQKIQDQINLTMMQAAKTRPGMVLSFNKQSNTARVLLDDQFSECI